MNDKPDTLEIVTRGVDPPATAEILIEKAITANVNVETMERLLAMRRELKAEAAKEAFDRAMSAFQSECPVIDKSKKVMNKDGQSVRYAYAPLDAIVTQVRGLLKVHGFGYRIVPEVTESQVAATCVVTHELGHSESASFRVPIDKESYMNLPQKFASALTFAKRYAFCAAFGIMTGDEDDDAAKAGMSPSEENQKARWAKSSSSSAVDPLHALKGKLWLLCKEAGATTIAEAQKNLQAHKIIGPNQALATLNQEQLKDAIAKLRIVLDEAEGKQ